MDLGPLPAAIESDGCSGFQLLELIFPIRDCCVVHDSGGSDGLLLDCLMANTPGWTHVLVAICVAIMILFRPVYRFIKQKLRRSPDGV